MSVCLHKMTKVISILAFAAMCLGLHAENGTTNDGMMTYVYFQPIPTSVGIGIGWENHRGGIFGAKYKGPFAYRSIGLEYAYHFKNVGNEGSYTKIYADHRQHDPGLKLKSRFVGERGEWEHDVLDHHQTNLFGAMVGHQWMLFSSSAFIQVGLGWQYNTNPVNIGPTMFGVGQSVKSRSEATGELGIGFLLK